MGRQGLYACCGVASPRAFEISGRGVFRPISAANGTTRVFVVGKARKTRTHPKSYIERRRVVCFLRGAAFFLPVKRHFPQQFERK